MSVIDKATKHFNSQPEKIIEVKEWDVTFVVKPLSLDDQRRLIEKSQTNSIEALVDLMIMKCQTEDGKKAFQLSDKQKLLNECDPAIIADIANQISGDTSVLTEKKS